MRDNPEGSELDPAECVRRRCKKNSPSVLSCIGKGQVKAVTVAAKSGQFTADETGKGQFFQGNRRYLAKEGVVRKISSPRRVAGMPNLCNERAGNMGKGECCSGFGERVASSLLGSPA